MFLDHENAFPFRPLRQISIYTDDPWYISRKEHKHDIRIYPDKGSKFRLVDKLHERSLKNTVFEEIYFGGCYDDEYSRNHRIMKFFMELVQRLGSRLTVRTFKCEVARRYTEFKLEKLLIWIDHACNEIFKIDKLTLILTPEAIEYVIANIEFNQYANLPKIIKIKMHLFYLTLGDNLMSMELINHIESFLKKNKGKGIMLNVYSGFLPEGFLRKYYKVKMNLI